jgi:hypothetical protein
MLKHDKRNSIIKQYIASTSITNIINAWKYASKHFLGKELKVKQIYLGK